MDTMLRAHQPDFPAADRNEVTYSPALERAFNLAAVALALLPAPVALSGALPVYDGQRGFLAFYGPFVCLLTLAYVIYVRDSLARVMFAHLLEPALAVDEFEDEPRAIRFLRRRSHARRLGLAVIPGLLLLTSFACVNRYTTLLEDSLHAVGREEAARIAAPEEAGALSQSAPAANLDGKVDLRGRLPLPENSPLSRTYLDVTSSREIPYFSQLAFLFIGAFLAPMLAVLMMAVREYAKEALGLSERDIVLGRILVHPE
jgi:hypothetical protein